MSSSFSSEVVFVAGGTGGLGWAVSLAFLREGATVIATYRSETEYERLSSQAGASSAKLEGARVDVTDEAALSVVVEGVRKRHGRIDALVNCVGGYSGGAKLWETELQALERMLQLNVRTLHILCRVLIPGLIEQRSGAVVNVAARAAINPPARASVCAAAKAAALAMTASLAKELVGTGVRINSVLPSTIDTAANRRAMPSANFAEWTKPEAIADTILFLCSDAARAVHGAAVPV